MFSGIRLRRSATALALAIASLGSVGIVALATATPSSAQPLCTDNWIGSTSGTQSWDTGSNWSAGTPNGSAVACIQSAGTYTVVFDNDANAPEAFRVGGAASGTQTLEVSGANLSTTEDDVVDGGGVLSLAPSSSSDADVTGGGSNGLTIDAGGSLTSSGTSEEVDIGLSLDNQGSMTFGATTNIIGGDAATNQGSLTVSSGATVTENSATFTDASGTLANDGAFNGENEFIQSGTTQSGNPVVQHTGTFVDSAGTGSFDTVASTTLEGTIPVGQTVTNLASPGNSNDTIGSSSAGVTVDGTLACQTVGATYCTLSTANGTWPGLTVASGGTLETTGPGSASNCGNGSCDQLDIPLHIDSGGTVTIANPQTNYNSSEITDDGTLQVSSTGELTVGGNSIVDAGSGTIGVTAGTTDGTIDLTSGNSFTCGTLAVDTAGSAADEEVILTPSGNGCEFDNYSFGPDYYSVTYSRNGSDEITSVQVTSATPFSASPTSFSAAEGEPVTSPQVATFDTNGEPGIYSATVDYGDGTGTQPATVNLSGDSGAVTGPTHTYTAPGPHTVTTTISTTAGTTISVTQSITVTGPTITDLSKTTIKPGKSLTTTVSGTNFDGTGTFSTAYSDLSVASVKFKAAKGKKPATYVVKLAATKGAPAGKASLTLTQTGSEAGTVTDTDAITVK